VKSVNNRPVLRILAVDDELPALDELGWLLGRDPRVGHVQQAPDGGSALRLLNRALDDDRPLDAVFLDVRMPGLDGLDVARVLSRFADPPAVVFVSAHDDFAVRAFELRAVDYLLKPVRPERLAEAVRRVAELRLERSHPLAAAARSAGPAPRTEPPAPAVPGPRVPGVPGASGIPAGPGGQADTAPAAPPDDAVIAVELSGVIRFIQRADVRHVEAYGDYVRLHLPAGSHLLRVPLSTLERQWEDAGFVRVHRRHLVATRHIEELLLDAGRLSVRVGGTVLPVSRRSTRRLREVLAQPVRATPPDRPDPLGPADRNAPADGGRP
jgi:DNA-binding LytR/AlgR family response regulator